MLNKNILFFLFTIFLVISAFMATVAYFTFTIAERKIIRRLKWPVIIITLKLVWLSFKNYILAQLGFKIGIVHGKLIELSLLTEVKKDKLDYINQVNFTILNYAHRIWLSVITIICDKLADRIDIIFYKLLDICFLNEIKKQKLEQQLEDYFK